MISVSNILKEIYPFDQNKIAASVAFHRGTTKESIIDEWVRTAEKGTIVHAWIEQACSIHFVNLAYNIILDYRYPEGLGKHIHHDECVQLTFNAVKFLLTSHIHPVCTEARVTRGNIVGVIDMIANHPTEGRIIIDWKTGKRNQSHAKNVDQMALYSWMYPSAKAAILVYLDGDKAEPIYYRTEYLLRSPIINKALQYSHMTNVSAVQ